VELANAGAAVVVQARRKERLDQLAAEIMAAGGQALVVAGDAAKKEDVDALIAKTLAWKSRIDIVVVNAGRGLVGGLMASDEKEWENLYHLNVLGAAYLMRHAGAQLIAQKSGDIVVLGSVAGHHISPFSGFYGSTKWAIAAAAEGLRREVCGHGVRVTTIKPGIVVSEFQDVAGYNEENFGKSARRFGKLLDAVDVARTIAFAVSQPPHVHLNEIVIRPTAQDYP
jgi:NADP-dependent 3-hydroxy acid dehydrogenase YdfG